jgi:hypothetical protein
MNLTDRVLYAVEVVEDVLSRAAKKSPVVVLTRRQRIAEAERHLRLGIQCAEHGVTLRGLDARPRHLSLV